MTTARLAWRERYSDAPLVDSVWTSTTPVLTSRMVIADPCTSVSLIKQNNTTQVVWTGPKTAPHSITLAPGYIGITIRLKPGVFLKGFSTDTLTNTSFTISADAQSRFWFGGKRLQFPDFDHAELLIEQLYSLGQLGYRSPFNVANYQSSKTSSRQVKRITGLSPYQLFQMQRIHHALRLLKQGMPATKVASELAFVDQSHLTRVSRQFLGYTPKQLLALPQRP